MGPPHFAEARGDLQMDFFSRRCFFRATPLLPGHKLALAEKRFAKVKQLYFMSREKIKPPASGFRF